jgi:hypothetical protein
MLLPFKLPYPVYVSRFLSHPLFVFSFLHLLTSVQNRNDSFPSEESETQEREFITVSMGSESSPIPREFSEEERLEKISSQLSILLMLLLRRLPIMPSRKLDYKSWCVGLIFLESIGVC